MFGETKGMGRATGPVFRAESGAGLMTLPGGVVLLLDEKWSQSEIEDFFSESDIPADGWSALGFLENGFLVETEPGFPSLELANELAAKRWRGDIESELEEGGGDEVNLSSPARPRGGRESP